MINLPAACPTLGHGSSEKPVYPATVDGIRCWANRCGAILPQVEQLAEEIQASGDDVEYVWSEHYPRLLEAALLDDLGLCPRCLRRLRRPRPNLAVFAEAAQAVSVVHRAATQVSESLARLVAVERRGDR